MTRGISGLAVAAALSLAGCGAEDDRAANAVNSTNAADGNAAAAPVADAAAGASPDQGYPARLYTLAGDGLGPGLAFGMAQDEAVAAATAAFGAPTERGHNDECGEGPMDFVSFGDLQLAFQDGRLAGWSLGGAQPPLRTASGLTVGSPRTALGDAGVDEESSLGPEFEVGGVGGILDRQGRSVEALWAGSTCQFR